MERCTGCQQDILPGLDECKHCHTPLLRQCPYCKERIKVAAVKCKFCQADLAAAPHVPQVPPKSPEELKLESDGQLAAILGLIAIIGFWITAPFAWYIGGRVNKRLKQLGKESNQYATIGWIVGMIVTILMLMGLLVAIGFFLLFVLAMVGVAAS